MDPNHTTPYHIQLLEQIAEQCFLEGILAKNAKVRKSYFQTKKALLEILAREKAFSKSQGFRQE